MSNEKTFDEKNAGIIFKDDSFANEMNVLRSKTLDEIQKGAKAFNENKISAKEYETAKTILLDQAREQRADIIRRRQEAISEAGIKIQQKMANSENTSEFREAYEKVKALDKEELISFYNTSLKLNDKVRLRASALIASEKKVDSILIDYAKRDPEFVIHFNELQALKERFTSPEKKMADQLGAFRSITPPIEKYEAVEQGKFLDQEAGAWRSYYKAKVKVKN